MAVWKEKNNNAPLKEHGIGAWIKTDILPYGFTF